MSRAASWVVALGGLALLTFLCVRTHGPAIEADLAARTAAALGSDVLEDLEVTPSGRDLVLTGVADTDADRARLGALAARVRGVRAVDNRLRLPGEALADEGDAPVEADAPPAVPFTLTDGPDGLAVRGTVPDDATRAALLARIGQAFPGRELTDGLTVDAEAEAAWPPVVLGVLGALDALPSGTLSGGELSVTPDGETLVLRGRVPDAAAQTQTEAAVQAAAAPLALRSELAVGPPPDADAGGTRVEVATPGDPDVAEARAALQAVFVPDDDGDGVITFDAGTSRLTDASLDLLDAAAGVLRRHPDVAVEIQGHTDSEGSAASNLRLSEQRADAVRVYLAEAGVARTRLTVRGLGEAEPIASNETPEGQARNRRVVFRLAAE